MAKSNNQVNGESKKKNGLLLVIIVLVIVGFLYFKGKDNETQNKEKEDDSDDSIYDPSGLKALVSTAKINEMDWEDFVDTHLKSRNNGEKASATVNVIMGNIIKNEDWVGNLEKPAEWAAIDFPQYVVRHAIEFALSNCKVMPKTESDGQFAIAHDRSMNKYFENGGCNPDDFLVSNFT